MIKYACLSDYNDKVKFNVIHFKKLHTLNKMMMIKYGYAFRSNVMLLKTYLANNDVLKLLALLKCF